MLRNINLRKIDKTLNQEFLSDSSSVAKLEPHSFHNPEDFMVSGS